MNIRETTVVIGECVLYKHNWLKAEKAELYNYKRKISTQRYISVNYYHLAS